MPNLTGFLSRLASFEPLRAWYRMIHKYVEDVEADFAQSGAAADDDEYYQYMNDRRLDAREVANIGAAGLCVAISSRAENDLRRLMELAGCCGFDEQSNYGDIETCWRRKFQQTCGQLADLRGHTEVRRVRLLANCFKHNHGWPNKRLLSAWPEIDPEQPIDFLDLLTESHIEAAAGFLSAARAALANYEAAQSG